MSRKLSLTDGWGVCSAVTDYSKQPVSDQTNRREGPCGASDLAGLGPNCVCQSVCVYVCVTERGREREIERKRRREREGQMTKL